MAEAKKKMKVFKGKSTELYCGHCALSDIESAWILLQKVKRIPRTQQPRKFTDGKSTEDYKRVYECPKCGGVILRSS
jgi:ribosomal protein S27AE